MKSPLVGWLTTGHVIRIIIGLIFSIEAQAGASGRIAIQGIIESFDQDQVVVLDQNHKHYRLARKYFSAQKSIWPGDHVRLFVRPETLVSQAKP